MADEKDTKAPAEETKEETTEAPAEEVKEAPAEAKKEETAPAKADKSAEEKKEEAPAEEEGADVEVPKKFKKIVEEIENMSVLDLNELVKLFEKKFGVSAAAVAVAGPGGGDAGAAEEKDEFNVELTGVGDSKIGVMKVVKEILGLGLKEAKELVESVPTALKEGAKKDEAEEMKSKIEEAGGSVELK